MTATRKSRSPRDDARTLAIDVGGSHIKASLVGSSGPIGERMKVDTPDPLDGDALLEALVRIASAHETCDRITVGVNGLVHRGVIHALPLSADESFRRFDLTSRLASRTGKPVCVMNDAEMHALGAIRGAGVELVITLGTGLGTALFIDGEPGPQLHFIASPANEEELHGGDYGDHALETLGKRKWRKRVMRLIDSLRRITNFDHLYVGGGNAAYLHEDELGDDVSLVDNSVALVGGARAWTLNGKS
jgi:polyphosphate glucokinase